MMWHYLTEDVQHGPIETSDLQALVDAGSIGNDTLVWTPGMAQWQPLATVDLQYRPEDPNFHLVPCSQCNRQRPANQTTTIMGKIVCASCKPLFIHRLKEGVIESDTDQLASIGARAGARIIDQIILMVVYFLLEIPLFAFVLGSSEPNSMAAPFALMFLVWGAQLVVVTGYEIFFLGRWGATPGKMICHIRVVKADGTKLTWGRAAGRGFGHLLTTFTFLIGYLIAVFDSERRALHDMICDTRVMRWT